MCVEAPLGAAGLLFCGCRRSALSVPYDKACEHAVLVALDVLSVFCDMVHHILLVLATVIGGNPVAL